MTTGACFRLTSTQKAVRCGIFPKFILQNAASAVCHSPFERGARSFLNTAVFDFFLAYSPAPIYFCPKSCSLGGCSPPALLTPSLPQINAGDPQTSATSKHESRSRLAGQPSGLFAQAWIPLRGEEGSDCTPWPSPRAVPQEPGPMRTGRALLSSVASRAGTGSPDGS